MSAKVRIGVIGTGWWATQYHIPSLLGYNKAQVVALADPNSRNLRAAAQEFGINRTFADYRELIAAGGLDGVVIAVPNAFHYEIARDALAARLHVLVEKPMALKAWDAWDLVRKAGEAGVHLVVGYTYHFTSHAMRLRHVIRSGDLGQLLLVSGLFSSMVESYYRGRPEDYAEALQFNVTGPGRETYSNRTISGGGQGQNQVTHAMGMVFWVTGTRAAQVYSLMETRDLSVDLIDAMAYELDNGAIGTLGSTGSLRPNQIFQQEFRYYGTEGFALQEIIQGKLSIHYNNGRTEKVPDLNQDDIYPAGTPSRHLVDLILGAKENLAPGEVGATAVEFLQAAYESSEKRAPVRIDGLLSDQEAMQS